MGKEYRKYDSPFSGTGRKIGIGLTVAVHAGLLFLCFSSSLNYSYPPPEEQGILLEFDSYEEIKPVVTAVGQEPRAKDADPENDIRLVQKSEAPIAGKALNQGAESTVGEEGDVEVPEPPRPKPINQRALFSSSRHRNDTLAAQVAEKVSDRLKAGHVDGNTETGNPLGTPTARLKGRSVMGNLPIPSYDVQKEGVVVVRIKVDLDGNVTNAIPGEKGTTVQDAVLWEAARKAALEAKFNTSSTILQEGTITYVFKLK